MSRHLSSKPFYILPLVYLGRSLRCLSSFLFLCFLGNPNFTTWEKRQWDRLTTHSRVSLHTLFRNPPLQAWQGAFLSFPYIKAEVLARFTRSSHSTANLKALKTAAGEGTDVYLHNLTGILIIVSECMQMTSNPEETYSTKWLMDLRHVAQKKKNVQWNFIHHEGYSTYDIYMLFFWNSFVSPIWFKYI